ncbi:hypothetical protein TL16_g08500 [Triparma laevis f. inornata]|uniref:Uncharacterized protein n=1 Tax=Triparma laevis f. inornata TaxID=1714386 RepID=A0A9W7AXX3_9STRA|nr:hypothetical protein TL16_g08500 [Triparma laevis f. inornata]
MHRKIAPSTVNSGRSNSNSGNPRTTPNTRKISVVDDLGIKGTISAFIAASVPQTYDDPEYDSGSILSGSGGRGSGGSSWGSGGSSDDVDLTKSVVALASFVGLNREEVLTLTAEQKLAREIRQASLDPVLPITATGTVLEFLSDPLIAGIHKQFLLNRPNSCTIRAIGARHLKERKIRTTYAQQKLTISPLMHYLKAIIGDTWYPGLAFYTFLVLCELYYVWKSIEMGSTSTSVNVTYGFYLVFIMIVNIVFARVEIDAYGRENWNHWEKNPNDIFMSDSTYLMMAGFDVLAEAEIELRNELRDEKGVKTELGPTRSLFKEVKESLRRSVIVESLSVHCLISISIWGVSLYNSLRSHIEQGETLFAALAVASFISRFGNASMSADVAMALRLNQKVHEFEVKRMQHDIRACKPEQVDLLVPRLQTLLKEMHQVTQSENIFLILWAPVLVLWWIMLGFGIYNLNVIKDANFVLPCWMLIVTVQPVFSLLTFYYGFAHLNRLTERDIDNDLILKRLELQVVAKDWANEKDDKWVSRATDKLFCLEQHDSRVCILPFHTIPEIGHAKQILRSLI